MRSPAEVAASASLSRRPRRRSRSPSAATRLAWTVDRVSGDFARRGFFERQQFG